MTIEIGKIKEQFVTLPKFLFDLSRPRWCDRPFLKVGRLYRGYVGVYWITRFFTLTIWIYYPDAGLRAKR